MKIVAYQIKHSEDMLIVDTRNWTVERQDPNGNILWREMFLDKQATLNFVAELEEEGLIYGSIV